jgi:hypothetical protein
MVYRSESTTKNMTANKDNTMGGKLERSKPDKMHKVLGMPAEACHHSKMVRLVTWWNCELWFIEISQILVFEVTYLL